MSIGTQRTAPGHHYGLISVTPGDDGDRKDFVCTFRITRHNTRDTIHPIIRQGSAASCARVKPNTWAAETKRTRRMSTHVCSAVQIQLLLGRCHERRVVKGHQVDGREHGDRLHVPRPGVVSDSGGGWGVGRVSRAARSTSKMINILWAVAKCQGRRWVLIDKHSAVRGWPGVTDCKEHFA
jgi:hypothetical protein